MLRPHSKIRSRTCWGVCRPQAKNRLSSRCAPHNSPIANLCLDDSVCAGHQDVTMPRRSVHRSLPRQLGSRTPLTFPWDALNARRPKSDLRVSPYRVYADLQGHLQLRNSRTRIPWRFLPPATALPFDTARPQSLASSEFWRFSSFRHDWHLWS